jgi:hypothetical protein
MPKKRRDPAAASRAFARKRHFASGGSPAEWRGLHHVHAGRRDRRDRFDCQGDDGTTVVDQDYDIFSRAG